MENKIAYRAFRNSDSDALANIIRETWNYDRFCSPKTAARMGKVYLYSCLTGQTYTQVVLVNNIPMGIIMGKNKATHKCPLELRIRLFLSILPLLVSKEGRRVSKIFKGITEVDERLLEDSKKEYPAELAFFAVSAKCRGKGIGKILFESLLSYMKGENIHEFYLFTDVSCNYQFYEHQGMSRRCQKAHTLDVGTEKNEMNFFLYDYQC